MSTTAAHEEQDFFGTQVEFVDGQWTWVDTDWTSWTSNEDAGDDRSNSPLAKKYTSEPTGHEPALGQTPENPDNDPPTSGTADTDYPPSRIMVPESTSPYQITPSVAPEQCMTISNRPSPAFGDVTSPDGDANTHKGAKGRMSASSAHAQASVPGSVSQSERHHHADAAPGYTFRTPPVPATGLSDWRQKARVNKSRTEKGAASRTRANHRNLWPGGHLPAPSIPDAGHYRWDVASHYRASFGHDATYEPRTINFDRSLLATHEPIEMAPGVAEVHHDCSRHHNPSISAPARAPEQSGVPGTHLAQGPPSMHTGYRPPSSTGPSQPDQRNVYSTRRTLSAYAGQGDYRLLKQWASGDDAQVEVGGHACQYARKLGSVVVQWSPSYWTAEEMRLVRGPEILLTYRSEDLTVSQAATMVKACRDQEWLTTRQKAPPDWLRSQGPSDANRSLSDSFEATVNRLGVPPAASTKPVITAYSCTDEWYETVQVETQDQIAEFGRRFGPKMYSKVMSLGAVIANYSGDQGVSNGQSLLLLSSDTGGLSVNERRARARGSHTIYPRSNPLPCIRSS